MKAEEESESYVIGMGGHLVTVRLAQADPFDDGR